MIEKHEIKGIAHTKGLSRISVNGKSQDLAKILDEISSKGGTLERINHNINDDGTMNISCIMKNEFYESVKAALENIDGGVLTAKRGLGKVSIVGVGVKSRGIGAIVFKILSENEIPVEMVSSSEINISCIVKEELLEKAANLLHKGLI